MQSIASRRALIRRGLATLLAASVPTAFFLPQPVAVAVTAVSEPAPAPPTVPAMPDVSGLSLAEVRALIERLQDLRLTMTWAQARWVWVDRPNWCRAHLQNKDAYLADPTAPAVCGRRPPAAWEGVAGTGDMIGVHGNEWICKKCIRVYRSQEPAL